MGGVEFILPSTKRSVSVTGININKRLNYFANPRQQCKKLVSDCTSRDHTSNTEVSLDVIFPQGLD